MSGNDEKHPKYNIRIADLNFRSSNIFQENMRNMTEEIAKQREQISHLLSKIDELRKIEEIPANLLQNLKIKSPEKFQIESAENHTDVLLGIPLNNEFEVIPFLRFTATRVYLVEPGLGRRVIEKPIGYKRKDIKEVLEFALKQLNNNNNNNNGNNIRTTYTLSDFLEGIYRTLPSMGTYYELYFRNIEKKHHSPQYVKVVIQRLMNEPSFVLRENLSVKEKPINIILPLSGRIDSFTKFMANFRKVCIQHDKNVFLTVVYFGKEGLQNVQTIVSNISEVFRFKGFKIIPLEEAFSRSRGLQVGAESCKGDDDILLFMCDVDVIFTSDFLERCRLNTENDRKVYYPIVFSLYNPKIVHAFKDEAPRTDQTELIISKETGFWRDFGYGMTCQYRNDFLKMKGFDEPMLGWGMEDVYLYRKYVKSNMLVVRSSDPGIFHIWHDKYCDPKLSSDRYRGCIRSKALNEASHSQLGLLAFKDEIDIHQALKQNKQ